MAERIIPPAPWENIPPAPWEVSQEQEIELVEEPTEQVLSLDEVAEQYPLGNIEVQIEVIVEETGEVAFISETADVALSEFNERINAYSQLLDCLTA